VHRDVAAVLRPVVEEGKVASVGVVDLEILFSARTEKNTRDG